jgi:crooked neck
VAAQITAEQIVREARSLQEQEVKAPRQKISDPEELADYRLQKRKEFEDTVRRVRWNQGAWVKYAAWEELQGDLARCRSVYERALDCNYRSPGLWTKYAEMEQRHKNLNHARNVWDRAVSLLPRIDALWLKFIHTEEVVGAIANARQIFERWMAWEPDHHGWAAYINLEVRHGELDRARGIYERYVTVHPQPKAWLRYAKFEAQVAQDKARCRAVYERAVAQAEGEPSLADVCVRFAQFEERCAELERARCIYRYALDNVPKGRVEELYAAYTTFEKQHGDREGIEAVVLAKRRMGYEEQLAASPGAYDAWFDYARLEEEAGDPAKCREVYERAVACVPPAPEKRLWRRYIYLWIKYALFEELEAGDLGRARLVYGTALRLVPHKHLTFGKLWILAAQAEIRAGDLGGARKLLGSAIGCCPKHKVFRFYIDLELQLGCVDRCRALYAKWLAFSPEAVATWVRFAQLERSLGEGERATALFELAVQQAVLDAPEVLWKAYIDAQIADGQRGAARQLYERLLQRTQHVKVWLSFAAFEAAPLPGNTAEGGDADGAAQAEGDEGEESPEARHAAARGVFKRADEALRTAAPVDKEARVMLLEAWRGAEAAAGDAAGLRDVEARLPKRVKRRRQITGEGGDLAGVEEYYDYIFPEDGGDQPNLKILEAARRWKEQQAAKAMQQHQQGEEEQME